MADAQIRVETLVTGSFVENGYILHREGREDAVLIDPGAEPERWQASLKERGLRPVLILATHAHLDHVGAVHALREAYDAPFALHAEEVQVLDTLAWQCRLFGLDPFPRPDVARGLADGDAIDEAGIHLDVLWTPGHTPGGASYHLAETNDVFTGDSLFAGTIGRTDLPGGDHDTLIQSLQSLCRTLPDETRVRPGHGPETTIRAERTTNPFFRVER